MKCIHGISENKLFLQQAIAEKKFRKKKKKKVGFLSMLLGTL